MMSTRNAFRNLVVEFVGFQRRSLALGVVLSAAGALLEGAGLLLLLPILTAAGVVDGAAPPLLTALAPLLGLPGLMVVWGAVIAVHAQLGARREVVLTELNHRFLRHLKLRLYDALLRMDWAAYQRLRSADVVAALTSAAGRLGFGLVNMVNLLARLLLIVAHAAIALYLAPEAMVMALAAGAVLALARILRLGRAVRRGAAIGQGTRQVHAAISEHVQALKLAKSHNAEAAFAAAFEREVDDLDNFCLLSVADSARERSWQKIGGAAALAVMVLVAVEVFGIGGIRLLVLTAVLSRLMPAVSDLAQTLQGIALTLPAYMEIETLRRRCLDASAPSWNRAEAAAPPAGGLVLRGVVYTWPGAQRPALDGIDLEIEENRTTALIGPSGGGKSTLADLCLGLLSPASGTVAVGGVALVGALRPAWRSRAAVVPQDVHLFHDTVRANLIWTRPDASEAELWQALEDSAAAELVRGLPRGLATVVGDRGVRLSGGERQRLALARALLRRPAFLVLDEATSHLDHGNERQIQASLERLHGKLTVLVIAHRLSTIRHADAIAVIENGRVVEHGGWSRLSACPGGFVARGLAAEA